MNTTDIRNILSSHSIPYKSHEPVPTGKFNTTFFCKTGVKDPAEVVLRIAPPDDTGVLFYERKMMRQEPGLHRIIAEKTSLPVPRIIHHDFSGKIIDRDYLVMERLPGAPLSGSPATPMIMAGIMEQAGRYIRELHGACRTERYGYLGEHRCMDPAGDWNSAFTDMWNRLIGDIRDCGVYSDRDAEQCKEALTASRKHFDRKAASSLLHMDIWGQNILVDRSGSITGIVDWDRALWGDPEIEFSVLEYCGFSNSPFWTGYGSMPEDSPSSRVRMTFYHLYEAQKYLVIWRLRGGDPGRITSYRTYALQKIAAIQNG